MSDRPQKAWHPDVRYITFSFADGRITVSLEWVATAENGWHAVVVNARVGWASGKYSVME